MSKIYADTIETENSNVDITLGAAGDAVLIPSGATLKTNKIFDAGGNNIITSDGSGNLTVDSQLKGYEVLLTAQTVSAAASVSFITLIDSTYDLYIFRCIEINPATDAQDFRFNVSSDGGSNYNLTKTSTYFGAEHNEAGTSSGLGYEASYDLLTSTNPQPLARSIGNESDENCSGELYLFNPSSTTYIKHFNATFNNYYSGSYSMNSFISGYIDTTSAINAIQFTVASGNMDGIVKMYGLSST